MNNTKYVTTEITFPIEFYDVDSMRIVWHGNYVKYFEKARCALLNVIGYNYLEMEKSGYLFPVTGLKLKYIRSLEFGDSARVQAMLVEYENMIKIRYEIYSVKTGLLCTRGESSQMCIDKATHETKFVCPKEFIKKVQALQEKQ
ncbi:MAG: acyl-CoA thioesterase [Treponema sp.]|nr:acyl-CoA thioesterase [Treponema sp.]